MSLPFCAVWSLLTPHAPTCGWFPLPGRFLARTILRSRSLLESNLFCRTGLTVRLGTALSAFAARGSLFHGNTCCCHDSGVHVLWRGCDVSCARRLAGEIQGRTVTFHREIQSHGVTLGSNMMILERQKGGYVTGLKINQIDILTGHYHSKFTLSPLAYPALT